LIILVSSLFDLFDLCPRLTIAGRFRHDSLSQALCEVLLATATALPSGLCPPLPGMHFAMPPRKTSRPSPYAVRNSRSSLKALFRRDRLRFLAVILLGCIGIIYLLGHLFSSDSSEVIPAGTPLVVIVTVINKSWDPAFVEKIKKNRRDYAARHGKVSSEHFYNAIAALNSHNISSRIHNLLPQHDRL
jgi:hypothetical protein